MMCCLAVSMNCAYAVAALSAARHYEIELSLFGARPFALLISGTALECICIGTQHAQASQALLGVGLGAVVVAAACDFECGYVFDAITMPSLGIMIVLTSFAHTTPAFAGGAAATGGALAAVYAATRGRGLGLGDVKLACCIGGCTGVQGGIASLAIAFALGGVCGAYLVIFKRGKRGDELRFAPFLAAGMAAALLSGATV